MISSVFCYTFFFSLEYKLLVFYKMGYAGLNVEESFIGESQYILKLYILFRKRGGGEGRVGGWGSITHKILQKLHLVRVLYVTLA